MKDGNKHSYIGNENTKDACTPKPYKIIESSPLNIKILKKTTDNKNKI